MNNVGAPHETDDSRHALISRLARRVREVRKQKGLPRRVVSEISGVSPRYLAQLEAGEGNISIVLLERVARALEVPIEALIARKISLSNQAQQFSALYDTASADVQAQIKALLVSDARAEYDLRRGRICLLGLRGAGKSTLGTLLSEALDIPLIELSLLVEQETGMPLSEVRSLYGANGFRRLEVEALDRVIAMPKPVIVTVSGGLAEQEAPYARLLERFHTIWLRATPAEHVERVRVQGDLQPLKDQPLALTQIKTLMDTRAPLYARAQAQLDTSGESPQNSLRALVALLRAQNFIA